MKNDTKISRQELSKLRKLFVVPDENVTIWRYVDFIKFVDLLENQCLFFSRADKLGDEFEGSCPKANIKYRLKEHRKLMIGGGNIEADDISAFYKWLREFTAVNCWYINEYESAAMWTLYLKSNEGIALRSSYRRLRDSFIDQKPDKICKVHYIDYGKDTMSTNLLAPYLHKRKSFEHESELRAIIQVFPRRGASKRSKRPFDTGICIPVNLDVLIDKIYVAPQTPAWQFNLVKSLVEKYDLRKEVVRSTLDDKPIY